MIAALYIDPKGPYAKRPDVDAWDKTRDARLYAGPWPVVAHPPCERWGRYAEGGPSARVARVRGDDGGCFASALAAVRRWGGVLEHPAHSSAWATHELLAPPRQGGWISAGDWFGWTCCVEQGHYGHRARKATWLYVVGATALPSLRWGPSAARARLDAGYHSAAERAAAKASGMVTTAERLGARECRLTPAEFAALLENIASGCQLARAAVSLQA